MITREIAPAMQVAGAPAFDDFTVAAWREHFSTRLGKDRFVSPQTVITGEVEDVPQALLSLLQGSYRGNVSVRLS
jgi:hypothetical protein